MSVDLDIGRSYEILEKGEWDEYLCSDIFDELTIDIASFGISDNVLSNLAQPQLSELIKQHNNIVGQVRISYALCKHYYDKGIPDAQWYDSTKSNNKSIQYMPLFQDEHWMRLFWFGYYVDTCYIKLFSTWDSLIEIINHFYLLDIESDIYLSKKVFAWLALNHADLHFILKKFKYSKVFEAAQKNRIAAAHSTSSCTIKNTVKKEKNKVVEIPEEGEDGQLLFDSEGRVVMKKVRATVISFSVGEYLPSKKMIQNIAKYSFMLGYVIQDAVKIMVK